MNGGNWDNGANAGLFYLNVNNAPSNANSNIGARLAMDDTARNGAATAALAAPHPSGSRSCPPKGECEQAGASQVLASADLFSRITAWENLIAAWREARRGKRNRPEVRVFEHDLEANLVNLHEHLLRGTWQPGQPRRFMVRDPKWREITAPPFADRIVHHAIVRVIEPLFERRFIHDSYACRKGKGTHAAVRRTQQFLRRAKRRWGDGVYVVHADVKSYFASIDHEVALQRIRRVVADDDVLWLWRRIMRGYGFDGVGLPVGALTSQLVANIVLDQVDHAIKDDAGEPYYLRYMDDMVAICRDKVHARQVLERMADACAALKLRLNPKSRYEPYQRGLDFCGYRIWPTHILPRKRNTKRWRSRLRALSEQYADGAVTLDECRQMVASCIAYHAHANAWRTLSGLLADTCFCKET